MFAPRRWLELQVRAVSTTHRAKRMQFDRRKMRRSSSVENSESRIIDVASTCCNSVGPRLAHCAGKARLGSALDRVPGAKDMAGTVRCIVTMTLGVPNYFLSDACRRGEKCLELDLRSKPKINADETFY